MGILLLRRGAPPGGGRGRGMPRYNEGGTSLPTGNNNTLAGDRMSGATSWRILIVGETEGDQCERGC